MYTARKLFSFEQHSIVLSWILFLISPHTHPPTYYFCRL